MFRSLTPATMTLGMFVVVGLLVAAYVAKGLMATEPPKPVATRNLPVPIADIPAGTVIRAEHLGMLSLEVSKLEPGMLTSNKVIEGRVAKEKLTRTMPVFGAQLYEYGSLPPLNVGPGMRAITFDVGSATSIVDGLIKPGQYVDVQFRPNPNAEDKRMKGGVVMTLLKGVHVLAINRQTQQNTPEAANTLTLELTPTEASALDLAKANGTLVFRYTPDGKGVNDLAFADPSQVTLEELLRLPPLPKEPEPAKPFRAQMYRQSSRQEMEFDSDNRVKDASGSYVPQPATPNRDTTPRVQPIIQTIVPIPVPTDAPNQPLQGGPARSGNGTPIQTPRGMRAG